VHLSAPECAPHQVPLSERAPGFELDSTLYLEAELLLYGGAGQPRLACTRPQRRLARTRPQRRLACTRSQRRLACTRSQRRPTTSSPQVGIWRREIGLRAGSSATLPRGQSRHARCVPFADPALAGPSLTASAVASPRASFSDGGAGSSPRTQIAIPRAPNHAAETAPASPRRRRTKRSYGGCA
jgi:hypothetical protein